MNFTFKWIKYEPNSLSSRMPERCEWIVCLKIENGNAYSFEGYFQKDFTGKNDYVFVYDDEKSVDGESVEIDYWYPLGPIVGH